MIYEKQIGIPRFQATEFAPKESKYCVCIPIINENGRIQKELKRAKRHGIHKLVDIILCDGGSMDGSTEENLLRSLGVNTLLVKEDAGKQGAQLRMGLWWALKRGYKGILTVDGNNKDSIEDIPLFLEKLEQGYDFVQGSRFIKGGRAIRTPLIRYISVVLLHAPLISLTAHKRFTDTTNAFRAYSRTYLEHPNIRLFLENRKNVSKEVKKEQIDRGVLYTSGLIAGEGLVGVLLAIFAVIKIGESSLADIINLSDFVNLGQIGSVIFFALLILTLFKFTIWYKDKNKAS